MDKITAKIIIEKLSTIFANKPALNFQTPYQLLVAVILSAQCTDERVNKVTRELFKEYDTPEKVAAMPAEILEKYIFSCGLYKTKAQHIISASRDIITKYGGEVPRTKEGLSTLAGVGRKTANVVYSVAFGGNAIAVDTHVFRVANRLGLTNAKNVVKTEEGLMGILNECDWSRAHHYLIYLGRSFCSAKKPNCAECPVRSECERNLNR